MADACREHQGRLAMAAIDRLDDSERPALDAHLDQCPACRETLAELTSTAAALGDADPARVGVTERPEPRPVVRAAVLAQIASAESDRRRRRIGIVSLAVAAAVVLVAMVFVGVFTRPDDPSGDGERVVLDPEDGETSTATATAVLRPRGWGTEIALEVAGLRPGAVYDIWLRRTDGTRVGAGSFTAVRSPLMRVDAACALAADQAFGIGVSTDGETVLYGHLEGAPDEPPGTEPAPPASGPSATEP
jgi:hypothetical protein